MQIHSKHLIFRNLMSLMFCAALGSGALGDTGKGRNYPHLEFLSSFHIPKEVKGWSGEFMGISSLYYKNASEFYAVSDDSGFCGISGLYCPGTFARLFKIHMTSTTDHKGKISFAGQLDDDTILLKNALGKPITHGKVDLEGMTPTPDGNLLMVSEQDISALLTFPPKIFEYTTEGELKAEYDFPKRFFDRPFGELPDKIPGFLKQYVGFINDEGCQRNKCFEGISFIPGSAKEGSYVTITELSLLQDKKSKFLRLLEFNLGAEQSFKLPNGNIQVRGKVFVQNEYAYEMEPIEDQLTQGSERVSRGVSDILAFAPNDYLVIERSYIRYKDKTRMPLSLVRIMRTSCENCTDVKEHNSLDPIHKTIIPMKRERVLDMLSVKDEDGLAIDNLNIEGISWGPVLADGSHTLIFVSDNGDNVKRPTRFLIFKTDWVPNPR